MDLKHLLSLYIEELEAAGDQSRDQLPNRNPDLSGELNRFFRFMDRVQSQAEAATIDAQARHETTAPRATNLTNDDVEFDFDDPSLAGRYKIIRAHAEGGLGHVSIAIDTELKRIVALKQIKSRFCREPANIQRFLREAEVTGVLEHPGIVPVYGMGQKADGSPYYAMRFVRGESLQHAIQSYYANLSGGTHHPLELRQLLRRFVDVCNTIEYAHSQKVIHRDIKPANIMLGPYGETLVVDWGLARRLAIDTDTQAPESESSLDIALAEISSVQSNQSDSLTTDGQIVGTWVYMSPEQARGETDGLTGHTDIFSLGATLFCILTGRPPYGHKDHKQLFRQVANGQYSRPRELRRDIPRALESICLKAMAVEPAQRYTHAAEMAADIEAWMADAPVAAHRETRFERWSRLLRRHRTWTQAAAGSLVLLSIGAILAATLINRARINEKSARVDADKALLQAQRQARNATALRLAASSLNKRVRAPVESSLLALEAARLFTREDDPILPQIQSELYGSLMEFHSEPFAKIASFPRWIRVDGNLLTTIDGRYRFERRQFDGQRFELLHALDVKDGVDKWNKQGRYIARVEQSHQIRLWDLHRSSDSTLIDTQIDSPIVAFEFDAEQPALITLHTDQACWWQIEPGALVLKHKVSHSISQPVKQITPLSKQHRLLVATDAELLIVDWTKAEIATHYRSEQSLGTILELDATGRWLLTTLSDDTIHIWNMALKQPTKREYQLDDGDDALRIAALDPNGQWAAATGLSGRVWLIPLREDFAPISINAHADRVVDMKFIGKNNQLASVGRDGYCRVWDLSDNMPRLFAQTHSHDGIVHKFDFDDQNRIIAGDDEGVLRRWDYQRIDPQAAVAHLHLRGAPWYIDIGKNDHIVASDTLGVRGWRPEQANAGLIQRAPALHFNAELWTTGAAFLHHSETKRNWLVTVADDGLRSFDMQTADPTEPVDFIRHRDAESSYRLKIDASRGRVIAYTRQHDLYQMDRGKFQYLKRLGYERLRDFSFTPDGKLAALAQNTALIITTGDPFIDQPTPLVSLPPRVPKGRVVELGPNGRIALMGDIANLGTIQIFTLNATNQLELQHTLLGHSGGISSCQFSADGRWFASASQDQTIRLWELTEAQPGGIVMRGPKGSALAVAFDPDSRWLLGSFETGDIYRLSLDINHVMSELERRCDRELSMEERAEELLR